MLFIQNVLKDIHTLLLLVYEGTNLPCQKKLMQQFFGINSFCIQQTNSLPICLEFLVFRALYDDLETHIYFLSFYHCWILMDALEHFIIFYVPWKKNRVIQLWIYNVKKINSLSICFIKVFFEVKFWSFCFCQDLLLFAICLYMFSFFHVIMCSHL